MFWINVAEELTRKGQTQAWLAAATGEPVSTLRSSMSRGNDPGVSKGVKYAKALGTTVERLVTGKESEAWVPEHLKSIVKDLKLLNKTDLDVVSAMIHNLAVERMKKASAIGAG